MIPRIRSKTSTIDIYVKLAQFPILADKIRKRMRDQLFQRGIISEEQFEAEVEREAIASQKREGLYDPFGQEPASIWEERKARIRAFNTDFWFGYNLPLDLFERIVRDVVESQHDTAEILLGFNPEIAPWEMLFRQGEYYEGLPPPELEKVQHHLEEIKVVLIRGMISDQLPLIGVAKKVLTISDLKRIYERRIGRGKIGGKAAGMIIAYKALQQRAPEFGADISDRVTIPRSYYLATDVMYDFRSVNNLDFIMNQKYRPLEEVREDYPRVMREHLAGEFPEKVRQQLRVILRDFGKTPIIVRSSSLLEDNFGSAFAGKYQSYFCPNQGTLDENLEALLAAIKRVYASSLNPDAILYRQKHGLIDYDERMAVLIQEVTGYRFGDHYFPAVAGVGYSQNPFRWNQKIRREEGFLRIVWGMGTRAVDRVSQDYPRMLALSHPTLRPETTARDIRQYAQKQVDVINLRTNSFETLPVDEVLALEYPMLRYIVSVESDGYLHNLVSAADVDTVDDMVITFDYLTRDRRFVKLMRTALRRLEAAYGVPVDTEFSVTIEPTYPYPTYQLNLLQCRPLSQRAETVVHFPTDLPEEDVLFREHKLVPHGRVEGVRYIVFVDPRMYGQAPDYETKSAIGQAVSRLNQRLKSETFILMGPGRWGSRNIDLGVRVSYADIHNTSVLVEIAIETTHGVPELSYGTHFFQDLVEANIYALPLHLDMTENRFRWSWFDKASNLLPEFSPQDAALTAYIQVIDVEREAPGRRLNVVMDAERDEAVGYLVDGSWSADPANGATDAVINSHWG